MKITNIKQIIFGIVQIGSIELHTCKIGGPNLTPYCFCSVCFCPKTKLSALHLFLC